ncbi:NUDIX domain-containing protein [Amphritea sp. 1_MG-2023]|uniref:NUDIX domain-containing protein n=1 Tax=Amphritea sp. 1_MG-2023 TaxID=3062670 RepID=UPI0026E45C89|nr:NUDIX domain-containing protein [Amphritea sp. 1_MG-2023]MDO6563258.1 NUDIX domain-containing protein [Amphritea sp. 1_MG-2023]
MAHWQPTFTAGDAAIIAQQRTCDGFFKIRRLTIRHALFNGGEIEVVREQCQRGDAVCVLLFDPAKDALVLVEQFRVGALGKSENPWLLELVAGIVEPGETPHDVALRESVEEAGAQIDAIVPITRYLPSAGGSDEYVDLLCARVDSTVVGGVHGLAAEGEDILVHVLPFAEVCELVANGVIDNAATIIAVQWLQLNRQTLLQRWDEQN